MRSESGLSHRRHALYLHDLEPKQRLATDLMLYLAIFFVPIALALAIIAGWPRRTAPLVWSVAIVAVGSLYVLVSGFCIGTTALDWIRHGSGGLPLVYQLGVIVIFGGIPFVLGIILIRMGVRRIRRRSMPADPEIFR